AAVVIVVAEPERMTNLVRRELPDAGKRPLGQAGRRFSALLVRGEQALGDEVVLAHAERAERDHALDDLARARVDDGRAVAPAASRAVHPVDHVVPDVERADAVRPDLDAERVAVAGGLERLVPPARALEQC